MDTNRQFLLHNFLFHIRTPLHGIKGALYLSNLWNENISPETLNWCEKWKPAIELWVETIEAANLFLIDDLNHNWEEVVFDISEKMKDVNIAHHEIQAIKNIVSDDEKSVFDLINNGMRYLEEIIYLGLNKKFEIIFEKK